MDDTSKQQTTGIFDRAAATYNTIGPKFFSFFAEQLVADIPIPAKAHGLDVATGSGAILTVLAKKIGPEGHVTGIDLSPQMVLRTAEVVKSMPNVNVQVMDAENLTFQDDFFDVVCCGFGIFFFPNYAQALNGFHRVLKPGGYLALSTWGNRDERYKWISEVLTAFANPSAPKDVRQTRVENAPSWDSPSGIKELLTPAGFQNISTREVSHDILYRNEQEWLEVQWSHGGRAWLEPFLPDVLPNVTSAMFDHLRAMQTADGIPQRQTALLTIAQKQ